MLHKVKAQQLKHLLTIKAYIKILKLLLLLKLKNIVRLYINYRIQMAKGKKNASEDC